MEEVSKKRASRYCAVATCKNNSSNSDGCSFFTFPKDEQRAKIWVENCNRPDLLTRGLSNLWKSVRVCSIHFERLMFLNFLKNRLKPNAIPVLHLGNEATCTGKVRQDQSVKTESTINETIQYVPHEEGVPELPFADMPSFCISSLRQGEFIQQKKISENVETTSSILLNELMKVKSQDIDEDDPLRITTPDVINLCDHSNDSLYDPDNKPSVSLINETSPDESIHSKKDTFSLTPENIGTVCRTCLEKKNVLHMFENKHNEHTYAEILEMCSIIKLEEQPTLSPYICQDCIKELLQAYNFREKCTLSEQTLLNFKTELETCTNKKICDTEQKKLILRLHNYCMLDKEDNNSIISHEHNGNDTKNLNDANNCHSRRSFYLLQGRISDIEGFKGDVDVTEIDEANAKTLMFDKHQIAVPLQVGNSIGSIKTTIVQTEKNETGNDSADMLNSLITTENQNTYKIVPYSLLSKPVIHSVLNGRFSKTTNIPKRNLDKVPKIKHKKTIKLDGKFSKTPNIPKRNLDKVPKIKNRKLIIPGACHICNEPYNTLTEYKQHTLITKHYLNPYVCEICRKVFPKKCRLISHKRSHDIRKFHMCEVCGKCFKIRSSLHKHLKTHKQNKIFACSICGKIFNTLREKAYHTRMSHQAVEKNHCCEFCGAFFAKLSTLSQHKDYMHLKKKHALCQICGKGFYSRFKLKRHMVSHSTTLFDCKLCYKSFKVEDNYLQHLKSQHPGATRESNEDDEMRTMECEYCYRVSKNKQSQTMHVKVDHKTSICIYCDNLFETSNELNDHVKKTHFDIQDFSCRYCGKCFEECSVLYAHLDSHKPKQYQCSTCFKKFVSALSLTTHMAYHTQEKKYNCLYCDKAFLYSLSCTIHERIHTGERPYVCDICGKGNICSSSYKKHRKIHLMPKYLDETLKNEEPVANIPNEN